MHVELILSHEMFPEFYYRFSLFIYKQIKKEIYSLSNKKRQNYEVRKLLLSKFNVLPSNVLQSLDLVKCINSSIELKNKNGVYIIQLNPRRKIKGTNIRLNQLVRLLEFGSLRIPELPVIRRVFKKYQEQYNDLFNEFIEEEFSL